MFGESLEILCERRCRLINPEVLVFGIIYDLVLKFDYVSTICLADSLGVEISQHAYTIVTFDVILLSLWGGFV